jgi:5-methylcytosine-specific restriction endonuclease McrA
MTARNSHHQTNMRRRVAATKAACHICGRPINYELPYLDPMAFVIDHVVPLARGGKDDITNIKAAHRECNSKKRARAFAPIVRRSGALD